MTNDRYWDLSIGTKNDGRDEDNDDNDVNIYSRENSKEDAMIGYDMNESTKCVCATFFIFNIIFLFIIGPQNLSLPNKQSRSVVDYFLCC